MQKIQESRIKMGRSVSGILTVFMDIVMRTPGLNAAHELLRYLIGETERHNRGQLNKGTEITAQKKNARSLLETLVIQICAAIAAFATASVDTALKPLKEKYQLKDSDITKKRDMQLYAFAYSLFDDVTPYAGQLEPFVIADDVAQLKDLADNFNALLPQKRTQQNKSTVSTSNLEDAIAQMDLLLNDTIDVLVKPWETKEADFFKAYKNARTIVDAATRKTKEETKPANVQE